MTWRWSMRRPSRAGSSPARASTGFCASAGRRRCSTGPTRSRRSSPAPGSSPGSCARCPRRAVGRSMSPASCGRSLPARPRCSRRTSSARAASCDFCASRSFDAETAARTTTNRCSTSWRGGSGPRRPSAPRDRRSSASMPATRRRCRCARPYRASPRWSASTAASCGGCSARAGRARSVVPSRSPKVSTSCRARSAQALGARRRVARATGLDRRAGGWTIALDGGARAGRRTRRPGHAGGRQRRAARAARRRRCPGAARHPPRAGGRRLPGVSRRRTPARWGWTSTPMGSSWRAARGSPSSAVSTTRRSSRAARLRAACSCARSAAELSNRSWSTPTTPRIAGQVLGDLRRVAGLRREPDVVQVWRARPGIPQYNRAQLARVRVVDDALARLPGLSVIGHALRGVGVSACIGAATALVRDIGA